MTLLQCPHNTHTHTQAKRNTYAHMQQEWRERVCEQYQIIMTSYLHIILFNNNPTHFQSLLSSRLGAHRLHWTHRRALRIICLQIRQTGVKVNRFHIELWPWKSIKGILARIPMWLNCFPVENSSREAMFIIRKPRQCAITFNFHSSEWSIWYRSSFVESFERIYKYI